jgi:hypothetical protein
MKTGTYNIDLMFVIDTKLTSLLKAFKTDELDQETINKEVEIVRAELYTVQNLVNHEPQRNQDGNSKISGQCARQCTSRHSGFFKAS